MPLVNTRSKQFVPGLTIACGQGALVVWALRTLTLVVLALGLTAPAVVLAKPQKAKSAPTAKVGKVAVAPAKLNVGKVQKAAAAAVAKGRAAGKVTVSSAAPKSAPATTLAKGRMMASSASASAAGSRAIGPGLRLVKRNGRRVLIKVEPPKPSYGQLYGLHSTADELELRSSVALVVDEETNEVLFSKNANAVLPIASITKLMGAVVLTQASLPMDEMLTVGQEDVQATAGSKSRLREGTQLTRAEMLHLSLMASENRAAHVLGRTYPGGMQRFVSDMNGMATKLGMSQTRYVEPTGLSAQNQSNARDLSVLVKAASAVPVIRELSTSLEMEVPMGEKTVFFRNTNGLVRNPDWEIGLQKTGYISAAGRCVVMQAQTAGRKLIMVLLDSTGKYSRLGDADRIRNWLLGASTGALLQSR